MGMNPAIPQSLSRITFGLVELVLLACLSKRVEGTAETVDEQATRAVASDSMDFIFNIFPVGWYERRGQGLSWKETETSKYIYLLSATRCRSKGLHNHM